MGEVTSLESGGEGRGDITRRERRREGFNRRLQS
jgi:hypothetical protein